MDEMSSAEFRKRYAKLTEPTYVTVNGHIIGTYWPGVTIEVRAPVTSAQAQRDALLNKINKPKERR